MPLHPKPVPALLLLALAGALSVPVSAGAAPVKVPREARAVDTSKPDRWVGSGTPRSCTSRAVVRAVAKGGIIRFRCGPNPVRIEMGQTAKVVNRSRRVVLDGGGLVTLSGGGKRRILYQNTCDQRQIWTTSHCDNQATPRLVVQNLTFADGDASGESYDGGGGGAIFARGGRLKIIGSTFAGNRCDATGPDLGGGAVRALSQHDGKPVTVVRSTFRRGVCSNGAALSSIGVSWSIYNSVFVGNRAIGRGANPSRPGTPGGGSGGAVYADGNEFRVLIAGTRMVRNHAREGGGAIFFVSNDRTGVLEIRSSTLRNNPSDGFETDPGIFFLGRDQIVDRPSRRLASISGVLCCPTVGSGPLGVGYATHSSSTGSGLGGSNAQDHHRVERRRGDRGRCPGHGSGAHADQVEAHRRRSGT
jgi:hypothetical protein